MQRPKSCRSLVLRSSGDEYLDLAPASLASLSLRLALDRELHSPNIAAIAKLTAITRLELIGFDCLDTFDPLFRMDLVELVLIDSRDIVYFLFTCQPETRDEELDNYVPRLAFKSLQRLHIEDNNPNMLPMQGEQWEPEEVLHLVDPVFA